MKIRMNYHITGPMTVDVDPLEFAGMSLDDIKVELFEMAVDRITWGASPNEGDLDELLATFGDDE